MVHRLGTSEKSRIETEGVSLKSNMSAKFVIEIYKNMPASEISERLADPECWAMTGSAAAMTASMAAALALRAAKASFVDSEEEKKLFYLRNLEIIRSYMTALIDEDVKSRGPLRKAVKEGGPNEIEAAEQTACAINAELINMMDQMLSMMCEMMHQIVPAERHFLNEGAELASAAAQTAKSAIFNLAQNSSDSVYRFVTVRENEITFERITAARESIRSFCEVKVSKELN